MNEFRGRRIVLGVTGGVAAYKAAELVRLLVKAGAEVDVVLTAAGAQFVGAATFQALTGRRVWQALWDERMDNGMAHIDLTRGAAALLVAPATADFLAKLAHGFADDLLSTLCLARDCPLLVAPAMNRQMWENRATQRNVVQLRTDGVLVLGPAHGEQACGEVGDGRMLEAVELFEDLNASLNVKSLAGKRVLLTAGPTFEALDPVRGLTNSSSGKMGFALARACAEAGAEVMLVAGPVALATPRGVRRVDVQSAAQMREAVMQALPGQNVFIGVAAVADYRPRQASAHKIKKGAGSLALELEANPDILAEVAALPHPPFTVGFAAETDRVEEHALAKLSAKGLDLIAANQVGGDQGGFERADNALTCLWRDGRRVLPMMPKTRLAGELAQLITERYLA
jgi:phosphopantothenoylcysteine decarboxylase/phosphopantothenate--cysteine ligase